MNKELVCIVCPKGCRLVVSGDETLVVTGHTCERGEVYGIKEVTAPTRVVTSTVKVVDGVHNRLPVKTNGDIPKSCINACMELINQVVVHAPIKMGDVLVEDILHTGVSLVATRDMAKN